MEAGSTEIPGAGADITVSVAAALVTVTAVLLHHHERRSAIEVIVAGVV